MQRYRDPATLRLLHRRARVLALMARVDRALGTWRAFDLSLRLPEEQRPLVRQPALTPSSLAQLRLMLGEDMADLDDAWVRRN